MKKTALEIYALAVCFFTVACFVIVLGLAAWHIVELSAPNFTIRSDDFQRHESDDAFREWLVSQHTCGDRNATLYVPPEGSALTTARERSLAKILHAERRRALQDLVQNFFILCINAVVFAFHWKVAALVRQNVV